MNIEDIIEAKKVVIKAWGEDGKKVIEAASKVKPFNGFCDDFLDNCIACGGDWGGMLLSGIRRLYPEVWEAIPNKMGPLAWAGICNTLILCGIDTRNNRN